MQNFFLSLSLSLVQLLMKLTWNIDTLETTLRMLSASVWPNQGYCLHKFACYLYSVMNGCVVDRNTCEQIINIFFLEREMNLFLSYCTKTNTYVHITYSLWLKTTIKNTPFVLVYTKTKNKKVMKENPLRIICSLWKETEILIVVIFFFFSSLLFFPSSQTLVCLTHVELREVLRTWETGKRRWRQNVPAALEAVRTEMFQREANQLQQLLVKMMMRVGLTSLMMRSRKQKVVLMCFSLSVCLSICFSVFLYTFLCVSICLPVCLFVFLLIPDKK